jgi:hypothetical protein
MDREKKTTNIFERTNKKTDKQQYKRKPTTSNPTMTGKEQLHRRKGKKKENESKSPFGLLGCSFQPNSSQ